jgi:hypothetical protein
MPPVDRPIDGQAMPIWFRRTNVEISLRVGDLNAFLGVVQIRVAREAELTLPEQVIAA